MSERGDMADLAGGPPRCQILAQSESSTLRQAGQKKSLLLSWEATLSVCRDLQAKENRHANRAHAPADQTAARPAGMPCKVNGGKNAHLPAALPDRAWP